MEEENPKDQVCGCCGQLWDDTDHKEYALDHLTRRANYDFQTTWKNLKFEIAKAARLDKFLNWICKKLK